MTTEAKTPTTPAQGSPAAGKDGATAQATSAATAATTEVKDAKATTAEAQQEKKETVQAGTEASKKDDAGAESKKDEAVVAPLEVKFKEGLKVDAKQQEGIVALAKELGLDSAKAQKTVDLFTGIVEAQTAAAEANEKEMRSKWAEELKADKEFGGANLEATKASAAKAIERLGGKEAAEAIARLGVADYPPLVKMLARAGKAISEDSIAGTTKGSAGDGLSKEEKQLRALFPTSYAK